jgi:hypothetical protein
MRVPKAIPREAMEKMAAQKAQAVKDQMYRQLLDSWSDSPPDVVMVDHKQTVGDVIREKIAEHKRMIESLEWFASHLSLDDPGSTSPVGRIILEGLNARRSRNF